jgi:hypothetical protein
MVLSSCGNSVCLQRVADVPRVFAHVCSIRESGDDLPNQLRCTNTSLDAACLPLLLLLLLLLQVMGEDVDQDTLTRILLAVMAHEPGRGLSES